MGETRRNHSSAFKAEVVFAATKGQRKIAELAEQFAVHPNQIQMWKTQVTRLSPSHCFTQPEIENRAFCGGNFQRTCPALGRPETDAVGTNCTRFSKLQSLSGRPRVKGTNAGSNTRRGTVLKK